MTMGKRRRVPKMALPKRWTEIVKKVKNCLRPSVVAPKEGRSNRRQRRRKNKSSIQMCMFTRKLIQYMQMCVCTPGRAVTMCQPNQFDRYCKNLINPNGNRCQYWFCVHAIHTRTHKLTCAKRNVSSCANEIWCSHDLGGIVFHY